MTLSNSIEEIITKKNKFQWVLPVWGLLIIGTIIFIINYENKVIKSEKSYKTVVKINSIDAGFYKTKASKKRKLKKTDLLKQLEYGQKFDLIDSLKSKWYKISVNGEVGIVKKVDCILDKTPNSEITIKRYTLTSENHKIGIIILIGIILLFTIFLKVYLTKLSAVNLEYDEGATLSFNKIVEEFKQIIANNYIWVIASEVKNHNSKKSAGASNSIDRIEIKPSFDSLPYKNIKINFEISH